MISIVDAIRALGVDDWTMCGEPTNEAEFNASFLKVIGGEENGEAITSSDPADFGVTWAEVKAKYDELVASEPMRLLRLERNQRLANTDWWASSDLTMTEAQTAYRQALRDITNGLITVGDVEAVVFPEKPEV
jgi:hypothetical protein